MNLPLKFAILATGKTQKEIAKRAGIDTTRMSKILRERLAATETERQRIAKVLNLPEANLFPSEAIAS